jgi:hypothetical protein
MSEPENALNVAFRYAQIDGAHHKAWVIDQMVRELAGDSYDAWVKEYELNGQYLWDIGIPP